MSNQELLKVYSSYLPYGVKVVDDEYKDIHTLFTVCSNNSIVVKNNEDKGVDVLIYGDFKLLLRPLSDLTKEIEHNGKQFVPLEVLNEKVQLFGNSYEIYIDDNNDVRLLANYHKGKDIIRGFDPKYLLMEWHFDVFSLIDQNLAINLNEVK